LRYHDRRARTYYSIFGKLVVRRHAFSAPGQPLVYPLDAALRLPERCSAALLAEWLSYGSTDAAYRETQTLVERILGLRLSVAALETTLGEDAVDLAAFAAQPRAPVVDPTASILVAQADGQGVPLVLEPPAARPVRPSSGRPPNQMQAAIVTALDTIAPYPRTADAIVAALLGEAGAGEARAGDPAAPAAAPNATPADRLLVRPQPVGNQGRATRAGKPAASADLAARVRQRAGGHIHARVALTAGAQAVQEKVQAALPAFTPVLDSSHATEYRWAAANALLGQRHPQRTAGVRTQLTHLLRSATAQVSTPLATAAAAAERTAAQRQALERTARYDRRKQPNMDDAHDLAQGWPIGTGGVAGAGGQLGTDRVQQAGRRWTPAGAQAVRDLRAVRLSGEWEADWAGQRQQQQRRLDGAPPSLSRPVAGPCVAVPVAA
jgi:hypothetical protein